MKLIVVTGLSGAGRSSALRALEDVGLRCVDNLPPSLLPALVGVADREGREARIAVGVDSRGIGDADAFLEGLDALQASGHELELLYLDAPDATLLRRFSETRRRHPLGALPEAIARERALLEPIRAVATITLDTENLRARELRRLLTDAYGDGVSISLVLSSFGFKKGLPPEADLVLDARGLENPHWDPSLRPRSGFHPAVAEFVARQPDAEALLQAWEALVRLQLRGSAREGRLHLTVAIGCTGGQHRSVALTRELARRLRMGDDLLEGEGLAHPVMPDGARQGTTPLSRVTIIERHRDVDRSGDDA